MGVRSSGHKEAMDGQWSQHHKLIVWLAAATQTASLAIKPGSCEILVELTRAEGASSERDGGGSHCFAGAVKLVVCVCVHIYNEYSCVVLQALAPLICPEPSRCEHSTRGTRTKP